MNACIYPRRWNLVFWFVVMLILYVGAFLIWLSFLATH